MKKWAVAVALLCCAIPASADSYRFQQYKQWVLHYQHLMGLEAQTLIMVSRHHLDYCAWVEGGEIPGFDGPVIVGLSEPDWACRHIHPRTLALHEMCHLRMHHLAYGNQMSDAQKHKEVKECMENYRKIEKEGR